MPSLVFSHDAIFLNYISGNNGAVQYTVTYTLTLMLSWESYISTVFMVYNVRTIKINYTVATFFIVCCLFRSLCVF